MGYSLLPTTEHNLFNLIKLDKDIQTVIGDIRDRASLEKAIQQAKPEIVFHLAAQPLVRESYNSPVETFETNVMGTVNVLDCVRRFEGVGSVINVTTDKVYENKEWFWGYRENDRLCGQDPYSNSKSCSELVTYSYRKSFFGEGVPTAISTARSGNVIGGGDFSADRIIPDCVRAATTGQTIQVRSPRSIRPYQHVLECLAGYLMLAQKQIGNKAHFEGSYNFGPNVSGCVDTETLVSLFCEEWGHGQGWEALEQKGPHESAYLKLDSSKANSTLGWSPTWGIRQAVRSSVSWYQGWATGEDMRVKTEDTIRDFFG